MGFAKYAQFYKDNGFFAGSKIKATVTDSTFIGQELILSKGNEVIRSMTIPTSGKVEFFTDESGTLTLSADNGTSTISGTVEIGAYATYEVTLNGSASDTTREVYADKENVVFDDDKTSDTVNISYTGDVSNLTVKSSNTNIATATLNGNKVVVSDAGKGFKGTSDITITVAKTNKFDAKDITIVATKENGIIDKSWTGLKNIVESGREAELCEVGEEYEIELSNGRTVPYIIGAIDHDYDHQIIFVPKRYFDLDMTQFDRGNPYTSRYENSSICEYLNGAYMDMLPSDLQGVISPKTIQYAVSNTALVSYTKKIWLPREYEILGTTEKAFTKEREIFGIRQMACFADNLVSLYINSGSSDSDNNHIPTCSVSASTTTSVVSAYRWKSGTSTDKYWTNYRSASSLFRLYPCFHLIKET